MSIPVLQPYPNFFDLAGKPLENGYLYLGVINLNPETNTIPVYWDKAMTQQAAQPIRTMGGFPVRNGSPAVIYVGGNYSITVRDKFTRLVNTSPTSVSVDFVNGVLGASSGAAAIVFTQGLPNTVDMSVQDVLRETVSVKRFNAKGDGITDDTTAFANAAVSGAEIIVPWTPDGYVVADIPTATNMTFKGQKTGISNGTKLIVPTNNAGAFTAATQCFQFTLANFLVRAANGVTGARFYKQADHSYYTAYANFENIETASNLHVSYDLFPIFVNWDRCRDGYIYSALAQGHQAISAIPASWSQGNMCNVNSISRSQFFGANGSNMAGSSGFQATVDVGYGTGWEITSTDFEALSIPGFRGRGLQRVAFRSCHTERISNTSHVVCDITPSNPIGSSFSFEDCGELNMSLSTGQFAAIGTASSVNVYRSNFTQIPAGVVIAGNYASINECVEVGVSGVGAAGFLANVNTRSNSGGTMLINQAADDGGGAKVQLNGILRASNGFTSTRNAQVTTSFGTIATYNTSGGVAVVNGFNNSGGAAGVWVVMYRNGTAPVIISSSDATGLTPSFQVSGASLQMKTTSGSLSVSVSNLV